MEDKKKVKKSKRVEQIRTVSMSILVIIVIFACSDRNSDNINSHLMDKVDNTKISADFQLMDSLKISLINKYDGEKIIRESEEFVLNKYDNINVNNIQPILVMLLYKRDCLVELSLSFDLNEDNIHVLLSYLNETYGTAPMEQNKYTSIVAWRWNGSKTKIELLTDFEESLILKHSVINSNSFATMSTL
jgi:hypothetical protein